jgi:hypothetical protein
VEWRGNAWPGRAWQGMAGLGVAWRDKARQGEIKKGNMSSNVRIIQTERKMPDCIDIRVLLGSALDAFCEQFDLAGKTNRKHVLEMMQQQAREMAEKL